jgi:hypothetical protein
VNLTRENLTAETQSSQRLRRENLLRVDQRFQHPALGHPKNDPRNYTKSHEQSRFVWIRGSFSLGLPISQD